MAVSGMNTITVNLDKLRKEFGDKPIKKIQEEAGKLIVQSAKAKVPVSTKPHKRYNTKGKVVATYYPGNLKRSIGIVSFKEKKGKITFVGPRLYKKDSYGDFKGNKIDGWYGHFMEYGTAQGQRAQPYMRPAYDETKETVKKKLEQGMQSLFNGFNPKK